MKAPCRTAGRLFHMAESARKNCDIVKKSMCSSGFAVLRGQCRTGQDIRGLGNSAGAAVHTGRIRGACGSRGLCGCGRASPAAGRGLLHWCGLLPAGLPLLAEGLGLVSYHDVFIYFICTVTGSHEKWHEMLYILWGKKYRHKQLVEKRSHMTRERLFDGSAAFF